MSKTVQCPTCKKPVLWSEATAYRPFCSERCRLIDLGAWADGSYAIPDKTTPADESGNSDALDNADESQKNEE